MASEFYIVHHHFKPDMAGPWWEKTGALMSDQTAFEQNVKSTMEKGFFNHSFMPMTQEGPIFCIWEVKDGKLYRGWQVSQPVTDKDDTTESYERVKV